MNMDAAVRKVYDADRRLVILRLLAEAGANTSVLEKSLVVLGHDYVDRAMVNDDARWLAQRGLVVAEDLKADLLACRITGDGERVAAGTKRVEGVARPSGG